MIRSLGGWSQVKALRRIGDREQFDERILGSGEFVERMTQEADLLRKYRFTAKERQEKADAAIAAVCRGARVSIEALRNGSRRREVSQVRAELAIQSTVELQQRAHSPWLATGLASESKIRHNSLQGLRSTAGRQNFPAACRSEAEIPLRGAAGSFKSTDLRLVDL